MAKEPERVVANDILGQPIRVDDYICFKTEVYKVIKITPKMIRGVRAERLTTTNDWDTDRIATVGREKWLNDISDRMYSYESVKLNPDMVQTWIFMGCKKGENLNYE